MKYQEPQFKHCLRAAQAIEAGNVVAAGGENRGILDLTNRLIQQLCSLTK